MPKFCTKCGHETSMGDAFCEACGQRLISTGQNVPGNEVNKEFANKSIQIVKKGRGRMILPIIIILLLISIPIVYYWSTLSTPEKTLKKFERSYNELDTDGMFECLDPSVRTIYKGTMALISGFIEYDADAIFKGIIGVYKISNNGKAPNVKFKIHNVNYTSTTTAEIEVTINYFNGENTQEEIAIISMKKVDDQWYLKMY